MMTYDLTAALRPDTMAQFASAVRTLADQDTERGALETVSLLAAQLVEGAHEASVTVLQPSGRYETVAASGRTAKLADQLQYAMRSGPCVDAIRQDTPILSDDLAADDRWEQFGSRAAALGARSVFSLRLGWSPDKRQHGLNIYSGRPNAFDSAAQLAAQLLGDQAAVAIRSARAHELVGNLQRALQSNRDIGVAMGIVMVDQQVSRDDAYALLRKESQHSHRKLVDIALAVADTGHFLSTQSEPAQP